jgi:predicted phosphate transport protein (TIGR00153 family)
MFMRFFRSLMPKEERFVEYFIAHSDRIVAAADALAAMMAANEQDRPARGKEVCDIESQADVIARQTIIGLHRAFITPFDRSDIHSLSNSLDDAVDQIEEVVLHAELYKVVEFDPRMRELTAMIQTAARLVAEAMPMLHDITGNAERIRSLCERVSKIEGDADLVLHHALSELVALNPDTITFFGRKEVYELLESVTDSCDDVADVIEGIVLDHV